VRLFCGGGNGLVNKCVIDLVVGAHHLVLMQHAQLKNGAAHLSGAGTLLIWAASNCSFMVLFPAV
jgi:hypothetical protein